MKSIMVACNERPSFPLALEPGMRRSEKKSGASLPATSGDGSAENKKARHEEVLESILGGIASGRLRVGDRLPTETELSKTFSASRTTVARALRELKERGLLNRRRGGGTRIARTDGTRIALFAPFATPGPNLGFTGGQIYTHLSSLASKRADHLSLQITDRTHGDRLDQLLAAVDEMLIKGVTGVFYYPMELPQEIAHYNQMVVDKMRAAGLAVVLVDRDIVTFPRRSDLALITYDNRRGGYLLCDHLIRRGCKRIVFIGIPFASSAVSDRMRGYCDAIEDHGKHPDRSLIRLANIEELTEDFCRTMMDECKPDAIICKMDHYAAIVGRHLVNMGLKIGQDVMLAGFDDQPIAEMLPVPLTTIRFPVESFAKVCYEQLMKQMTDPSTADPGLLLMNVELVLRASSGGESSDQVKPAIQTAAALSS
jgi:GntR family transcriptional regulator of arabinose operon